MKFLNKRTLVVFFLLYAVLFLCSSTNAEELYNDKGFDSTTINFTVPADSEVTIKIKKNKWKYWDLYLKKADGSQILSFSADYFGRVYSEKTDLQAGNYSLKLVLADSWLGDSGFEVTITADITIPIWYEDKDGDGFGNSDVTVSQDEAPEGYVSVGGDCDDLDNEVYPGAPELCDLKDNNCDGNIDEGFVKSIYYMDSDGDGYGDPNTYISACKAPPNYVEDNTDCNDNNPAIHPGAFDPCDTPEDENCSGSNEDCSAEPVTCRKLANYPLETEVESADPLLIFVVDDSGSMLWDVLCPENSGAFKGQTYVRNVPGYWKSQWAGYNGIYYDPELEYNPWPGMDNADINYPKNAPDSSGTTAMTSDFSSYWKGIHYSHYYVYSSVGNAPYLVNIGSSGIDYYKVSSYGSSEIKNFTRVTTPPSDVAVKRTLAEERQNFANWFTYYRNRQRTAIAALAKVVNTVKDIKIGIHSINGNSQITIAKTGMRDVNQFKDGILADLYKIGAGGGTPLRRGLKTVGEYYKSESSSPYASDGDGGSCQQAFTIVMTDGYYNGDSPNVGNADGDKNTKFDGHPYGDTSYNTLADVAMHYYENDLNTTLNNNVHTTLKDTASHQHMVTFTVSFGLTGTIDYTKYPSIASFPENWTWPSPNTDEKKIDDLWHAAVNGRGSYLAAKNAEQLAHTLTSLMQEIQTRSGSGASVALNTDSIEQGTYLYQGSYNSAGWTGDLRAYAINSTDGSVSKDYAWSAAAELDKLKSPEIVRKVFTFTNGAGSIFAYDNISAVQKAALGADETTQKAIIDYLKGKYNASFRSRGTILGDIVHSAPVFHNNALFVGANDGMLHAFAADTGKELFSYIPSFVYDYGKLRDLADPDYEHNFYVDGTPFIKQISATTDLLVCGLGKGGKGYFALNVKEPASFQASKVLWEYPGASSSDLEKQNMGYSFSKPAIISLENPVTANNKSYSEVIIFGNGYDSENGRAVLYIIGTDGKLLKMIDTGYGDSSTKCNGLSTPIAIDPNLNGKADYIYAGDLQGNLWKFDISGSLNEWGVFYKDSGSNSKPLVQVKDSFGNPQPITSKPAIMLHCSYPGKKGYAIVFGTGSFNSVDDFDDSKTQSVYGIWDWSDEWQKLKDMGYSVTVADKYYGEFLAPLDNKRLFSNIKASSLLAKTELTLLNQQVTDSDSGWGTGTDNTIFWFDPMTFLNEKSSMEGYKGGLHVGWFVNLTNNGERVIADATIRGGNAIMVTLDPSSSPCETGGYSYLRVFDACSGGSSGVFFDTDRDFSLADESDNYKKLGLPKPPSSKRLDDIYYKPVAVNDDDVDKLYFDEKDPVLVEREPMGIVYWKLLND